MVSRTVTVVVGVILCGLLALGATLRVPSDFATIQKAVDAAKSGDVVLIAPGIYEGAVVVDGKTNLTIKGDVSLNVPEQYQCCPVLDPVAAVVLRGPVRIISSTDITLETMTVSGLGVWIFGTRVAPAADIALRYCRVLRNNGTGIVMEGIYTRVHVLGCDVSLNGQDGIHLKTGGSDIVIDSCCINFNGQTSWTGVGVRIEPLVKPVTIIENCIEGNRFAGVHPG